jgi:hypothetical protein
MRKTEADSAPDRFRSPRGVPIISRPMPSLADLVERAELVQQRIAQLKEGL